MFSFFNVFYLRYPVIHLQRAIDVQRPG